ncbi:MAG: hypothetical protein GKS06_13675 [Acidobacteria bacterium]|nr:hypothetical protein [Acidobacteriota bacterium]
MLTAPRQADLNAVVADILERYPDSDGATPWDIEFGFLGDETVLFQIRPFVLGGTTLAELSAMDAEMLRGAATPVPLDGAAR